MKPLPPTTMCPKQQQHTPTKTEALIDGEIVNLFWSSYHLFNHTLLKKISKCLKGIFFSCQCSCTWMSDIVMVNAVNSRGLSLLMTPLLDVQWGKFHTSEWVGSRFLSYVQPPPDTFAKKKQKNKNSSRWNFQLDSLANTLQIQVVFCRVAIKFEF